MSYLSPLSTAPLEHPAIDYAFLRQEGIRHLERMAGPLWTDFNAHDPGITILDQLCYALTDLGYRIDYDLKDLLASGGEDAYGSLYSPAQILTSSPVTLTDLRKAMIDVAGVKNAWLEPVEDPEPALFYDASDRNLYLEGAPHRQPVPVRGVYRVLIEADGSRPATDLIAEVSRRLHAGRNLGQDFDSPTLLPGQPIIVNAEIEVGQVEDPERLLAEIYQALAGFIAPRVRFYRLDEMIERGKPIDAILDGPVLEHGFIDTRELEGLGRKSALRTSDLIQVILDVAGVTAVNDISLSDGNKREDWYLELDRDSTPFLDIQTSLFDAQGPHLRLARGRVMVQPDAGRVKEIYDALQEAAGYEPLPESQRDVRLPPGRDRQVGGYHSIQHHFPAAYGIGPFGLPASAPAQRRAQAKQLKAYLMFFDQLLANYFAQLANVKELFSFQTPQPRTYFAQVVEDAELGLDEIWDNNRDNLQSTTENPYPESEGPGYGRKNRFLNHLLARFAEEFTDYSLLQYGHVSPEALIKAKCAFLQDYGQIGAARGRAFDYTRRSWETDNVSGLEKRIGRKLGLSTYRRRNLADLDPTAEGGFHMVEHILLRPRQADKDQWTQAEAGVGWQAAALLASPQRRDPYSLQLSVIFPVWIDGFKKEGFRNFIRQTLREETPAHLSLHLHWLGPEEMRDFEAAYQDWLESVTSERSLDPRHIKTRDARDRMVQILGVGTPYPLRDLDLEYPAMVAMDQAAEIHIPGGQSGVVYQVCDQDGNPVEGLPGASGGEAGVILLTPEIVEDITFTIMASREHGEMRLETYLVQAVSIKAGIDTGLPVATRPAATQTGTQHQVTIDYGDKVRVRVQKSQEGISYELVTDPGDDPLSEAEIGNKETIELISSEFTEDTQIKIRAYRTLEPSVSAYLDAALSISVRPDPAVAVTSEPSILDYGSEATLSLAGAQASADYVLYKRELVPSDYVSQDTPDRLEMETSGGQRVYIRAPERVTDWDDPAGFVRVGEFQGEGDTRSISTGTLPEDTLFIVQATKKENRERLQLDQALVVLVSPDTAPVVSAQQPLVDAGSEGMVTVSGTQPGVSYQLRLDEEPVNPPGYHYEDRGVDTTRLQVDFVVETEADPLLLLPTGPLTEKTTFNVLATKILTRITARLAGEATIDVRPEAGDES